LADYQADKPSRRGGDDTSGLLETAGKRWDAAWNVEKDNINRANADLRMLAGDETEHWGVAWGIRRAESRPTPIVNVLPQYVSQITGDQRKLRPGMRVVPVDGQADKDTAEKLSGMLRYIEHASNASSVYARAAESQVSAGIGHWRVLHDYASESTFNKEIRIAPVSDMVFVLWDPDALQLTRSDAEWCHVPVDMSIELFKRKYGEAKVPSDFGKAGFQQGWQVGSTDLVRLTEYWWKQQEKKLMAIRPDGGTDDLSDEQDLDGKRNELQLEAAVNGWRIVEREDEYADAATDGEPLLFIGERDATCVYRAVMTCTEIVEPKTKWIGRYIPVVPVIGNEIRVGRTIWRSGAVKHARDSQQLLNYFNAAHAELHALAPKAPYVGTQKMFEEHLSDWENANRENRPYLPFTPDPEMPGMRPERIAPPSTSPAIESGLKHAEASIQATIGIYKSSIGAESNEKSGVAIRAREQQADTSTYVYIDNLSQAIAHTARIIVDLIPHVYDTERQVRIVGQDGSEEQATINKPGAIVVDGKVKEGQYDVTTGAYDVVLESGPSYDTKKTEAREGMTAFLQALPPVAPFVADLVAKAQDWPMADEFAKRLRMALPPQVQQLLPQEGAEPDPAMQHIQIEQHKQQAGQEIQAGQQQLMQAHQAAQQDIQGRAQQEQAKLDLVKGQLDLRSKELAFAEQQFASQVQATQQGGAENQNVAQQMAQMFQAVAQGVQMMPEVVIQQLAPALQEQSARLDMLGEALGQLLAVAQAPVEVVRDQSGLIQGAQKRLNNGSAGQSVN
jgi:hypothetical protein